MATGRNKRIDKAAVLQRVLQDGPDALLSIGQATALILDEARLPHETESDARDRVAQRIRYAMKPGPVASRSPRIVPTAEGLLTCDELVKWAKDTYRKPFSNLPKKPREHTMSSHVTVGAKAAPMAAGVWIGSLERSNARIAELEARERRDNAARLEDEASRIREKLSRFKKK